MEIQPYDRKFSSHTVIMTVTTSFCMFNNIEHAESFA